MSFLEVFSRRRSLFFVSSDSFLTLFFDTPVFPLGLQAESFLSWSVEFSVMSDVAVEGF